MERGVYHQESLQESERRPHDLSKLHEKCIVVYEVQDYTSRVVEIYPLPSWFWGMDVSWMRDLQEAVHSIFDGLSRVRHVQIRPTSNFFRQLDPESEVPPIPASFMLPGSRVIDRHAPKYFPVPMVEVPWETDKE